MDWAEGLGKAKPYQCQRSYQHQERQHGTTERAHCDADRPIAEAQSQYCDKEYLEKAQSLQGL